MAGFHRVELAIGGRTLSIETGKLAKQADGSVLVQYGETVVLGAVCTGKPREGLDFFPLTVDYREKTSAAGKFPGGFRKREGAPNTKEIITMRNIDRPIRPLFPKGYFDEVQVQCWVLAADGQNEPDVLAGIAASAALSISSAPFDGPVGNVRVGRVDGELVIFPTTAQNEYSDLDLLLCGHREGLNMIEVGAYEIPEDEMVKAIDFGREHVLQVTELIEQLVAKAGKEKVANLDLPTDEITANVREKLAGPLRTAKTAEGTKLDRQDAVKSTCGDFVKGEYPEPASSTFQEYRQWEKNVKMAKQAVHDLEEEITREIIASGSRTDGRGMGDLRKLESEVSILPRVHGSGLFTRGETQALVTVTLGTGRDEQIIDGLADEYAEKFYLHYNFPPFSVGETKRISGPGRREIGHGKLAERALIGVLPSVEDFPYTIRLVSDIFESNGSSSMASACGGTLAMLDAGVPLKAPVAGISIGMISKGGSVDKDIYLTDIQGEEDHFGDMDFKVTGTTEGITAIQLDLKIKGLNMEQIIETLKHAREARLKILENITAAIPTHRAEISKNAPRMLTTHIDPDKIGKLIGPGGKMIRAIQEESGATIEVEDDGTVMIFSSVGGGAEKALEEVERLCAEVKVGTIYTGKVTAVKDFGAFIEVIPGQDGLCHISELADGFVEKVADIVAVGDVVRVKVILVDDQGRVKLSRRQAMEEEAVKEASE